MHTVILQIDEVKNNKRIKKGLPSLIDKPYDIKTFSLKNYKITHIYYKYEYIDEKYFQSILHQIEKDFKSFYTCEERPQNGIILGDVVKIGRHLFYYNGLDGWKYLGKDKLRRI